MTPRVLRPAVLVLLASALSGCSPVLYAIISTLGPSSDRGTIQLDMTVTGSTSGAQDEESPSCGGSSAGDNAWDFVPPQSAVYRVLLQGAYDCVVAVQDPGGHELACNDDTGTTTTSMVQVSMQAGEHYTIVVDGYHENEGSYSLVVDQNLGSTGTSGGEATSVESAASMQPRCDAAQMLMTGAMSGTLMSTVGTARTSCGGGGPGGDVIYRLIVTEPSALSIRLESTFDGVLELRSVCSGAGAIACNDDVGDTRHSQIDTHLAPGNYFLVVDAYSSSGAGTYTLQLTQTPDTQAPGAPVAPVPEVQSPLPGQTAPNGPTIQSPGLDAGITPLL